MHSRICARIRRRATRWALPRFLVSPPGRHSHAAVGLMFCRRFSSLLNVAPLNGWTDRNPDSCVNTSMKKFLRLKIMVNCGQGALLWQPILWRETSTSCPSRRYCLCWHLKTAGKIAKRLLTKRLHDEPSTSGKNFLNFGPVTAELLWPVCRKWVYAHVQKYARLRCFHHRV